MSTNCLVTKLKAAVDNFNLPKMNEFRINFYSSDVYNNYSHAIQLGDVKAGTVIETDSNHVFYVNGGEGVTSYTVPSQMVVNIKGQNDDYFVRVLGRDNIDYMQMVPGDPQNTNHSVGFSLDTISLMNLVTLQYISTHLSGVLKKFSHARAWVCNLIDCSCDINTLEFSTKKSLTLNGPNVTGSIDNDHFVGQLQNTNLDSSFILNFEKSQVNGSVEQLASQLVSAGKTSGAISCFFNEAYVEGPEGLLVRCVIRFSSEYPNGYSLTDVVYQ